MSAVFRLITVCLTIGALSVQAVSPLLGLECHCHQSGQGLCHTHGSGQCCSSHGDRSSSKRASCPNCRKPQQVSGCKVSPAGPVCHCCHLIPVPQTAESTDHNFKSLDAPVVHRISARDLVVPDCQPAEYLQRATARREIGEHYVQILFCVWLT